jgi:hypothetical protein
MGAGPAPDTTAPTVPGAFQALVSGDNAVVNLSWSASVDSVGVTGYWLERSLDQSTWTTISESQADTRYRDDHAAFGVHYFYRVKATDAAGNSSPYAQADASTPEFAQNTTGEGSITYTSDDQIATVTLPAGALGMEADCSIVADEKKAESKKLQVVAGPYLFLCKDAAGNVITVLSKPIVWTYNLKTKLRGYTGPQAITGEAKLDTALDSRYDKKAGVLQFTAVQAGSTAVLASTQPGLPLDVLAFAAVAIILISGGIIWWLRRSQKQSYDDYLRSKYYNL